MKDLMDDGLVRAIGICDVDGALLEELLRQRRRPHIIQNWRLRLKLRVGAWCVYGPLPLKGSEVWAPWVRTGCITGYIRSPTIDLP